MNIRTFLSSALCFVWIVLSGCSTASNVQVLETSTSSTVEEVVCDLPALSECAYKNLNGADLSGYLLQNASLQFADLQGVNLEGADLTQANLAGANLQGANLQNTKLIGANLHGANLSNANLVGAILQSAKTQYVNFTGADLTGVYLGGLDLLGSIFSNAKIDSNSSELISESQNNVDSSCRKQWKAVRSESLSDPSSDTQLRGTLWACSSIEEWKHEAWLVGEYSSSLLSATCALVPSAPLCD